MFEGYAGPSDGTVLSDPVTVLALALWNPLAVGESGEDAGAIVVGQAMLDVPPARAGGAARRPTRRLGFTRARARSS